MAQKYNPTTGQWEEEEDEGSLTSGTAAAFGAGSAPAVDGSAMTAGIPQFSNGAFSNPQYNLNSLPEGYGWGDDNYLKSQGYTKQYASPWDTSYNYLDSSGKSLGKGYDSYQDAIRKLAFTSGMSEVQPTQSIYDAENGAWSTASPGGYTHSYYGTENQRTFTTQQELYNALLKEAGNPLGYESREKYGRKLTEGQLQNMYSQYATGALSGTVPDWTYHRAAYPGNDGTFRVTGEQALIDSDAFFGPDGILGYRTNLNPGHLNFDDTSGRVTSSTHGNTSYIPGVESIVRMLDKENGFIGVDDISKFGYKSSSMNDYNKADSTFESLVKKAAPLALAYFAMPQLASLFAPEAAVAGTVGSINPALAASFESLYAPSAWAATGAGAGTLAGGLDIGAVLGETIGQGFSSAVGFEGSMVSPFSGGIGSVGGLGLEGLPGLISDIGSWVGDAAAIGGADSGAFANIGEMINGFDPSAFTGSNFTPSLGDAFTSTLADTGASSLSNFAPEIMGPQEPFYFDDWGKGTNALGEMTNGKGFRALQDIGANTLRDLGVPRETAANLSQGAGKMYNFMTQSPGKAGMFKAPSPLEMLYKGGKAFMDYRSNKEAMGMYEDQIDKMRAWDDPNRARGDFANKEWMNTWSNPRQGFDQWMSGLGREFQQKANAAAAAGGKRGSYMNSGKGLTDLYSKWMAGQNDRANSIRGGFSEGRNTEADIMRYMAPMLEMKRNEYAPFGQAIDSIMRGFQLSDLFGG